MQLDVLFTRRDLEAACPSLEGATCVVIDVLRASTTIIQALSSGAGPIYIAGSPEEAFELRERIGRSVMLCGERNGLIIPGFDLGNSPLEYTEAAVSGKTLIFASTNGSKTLLACAGADEVLIGGFTNLYSLLDEVRLSERLFLVCSGKLERFSIEDAVCAGMIIDQLIRLGRRPVLRSDSAVCARWLFERYISAPDETFASAEHPNYLAYDLGLVEDVAFCTKIGSHSIVPRFEGGLVTR